VLSKRPNGAYGLLGNARTLREVHGGSVAAGVTETTRLAYNRRVKNKLGE